MTDAPKKTAAPAAPAAAAPKAPAPAAPAAPAAAAPKAAAPTAPAAAPAAPAKSTPKVAAAEPVKAVAETPEADGAPKAAAPASKAKVGEVPKLGDEPVEEGAEVPALGDEPSAEPVADESAEAPAEGEDAAEESATEDGPGDEPTPIEYEFTAPEGQQPYRPELVDTYKEVLQKHRVAPEVAQDILDTMMPAIRADVDQQVQAGIEAKSAEWRSQLEERHGKNLRGVMNLANRGLAKSASPEFIAFVRDSALAWNPDFIDMLAWVGQRVSNDRSVKATEPPVQMPADPEAAAAAEYDRQSAAKRG